MAQKRKILKKENKKMLNDYKRTNALGATFWMSLSDFTKYFYILTVNYTNKEYVQSFLSDQAFSYKWCCLELDMPKTDKDCFFSLYQMNDRFMDDYEQALADTYQYAEM